MWSNPTTSPTGYSAGAYGSSASGGTGRPEGNPLSQEPCRFFLSGGCLRGDACPYLHEFPDDRHLDVAGVGFIFNSNVKNSSAALQRNFQQPAGSSGQPSPGAPPAYNQAGPSQLHKSPQPQPQPSVATSLGASRSVGSAHAQPFVPQQSAVYQTHPQPSPAVQSPQTMPPFQATAGIYTYAGQPSGAMHAIPQQQQQQQQTQVRQHAQPAQSGPMFATMPSQPPVTHLQTVNPSGGIGPITIITRQEPGPYAPPMPLPYALPPQLGYVFDQSSMTPIPVVYTFGAYSPQAQHAAALAMMIPTAVSCQ